MRLNHAMLFVSDLPRMTAFYSEILGLKPIEASRLENYVEFDAGEATFALHAIPVEARCTISSPPQPRENTPIKLSFEVEDVRAECEKLKRSGVTIIRRPWGSYDGVDPEGNIFGIYADSA
jgi:catechol 2,3-dioxygenase-like lactoylglutathione lyase family enzyme